MHLRCFDPNCAATLDLHAPALACPKCGELLEVDVALDSVDASALKSLWTARRTSRDPRDISGVWRYRELGGRGRSTVQASRMESHGLL
jgi:threonine synthase